MTILTKFSNHFKNASRFIDFDIFLNNIYHVFGHNNNYYNLPTSVKIIYFLVLNYIFIQT